MNFENKDDQIQRLVDHVISDLDENQLSFVDFWDSDRCSIGVMNKYYNDRMIYIVVWLEKDFEYYIEGEIGDIFNGDTKSCFSKESIDYNVLKKEILEFLLERRMEQ